MRGDFGYVTELIKEGSPHQCLLKHFVQHFVLHPHSQFWVSLWGLEFESKRGAGPDSAVSSLTAKDISLPFVLFKLNLPKTPHVKWAKYLHISKTALIFLELQSIDVAESENCHVTLEFLAKLGSSC